MFVFGFYGFMQRVSPKLSARVFPLLSCTGISVYLLTSKTESCDEDVEEAGEDAVEEKLIDQPGTTNGT